MILFINHKYPFIYSIFIEIYRITISHLLKYLKMQNFIIFINYIMFIKHIYKSYLLSVNIFPSSVLCFRKLLVHFSMDLLACVDLPSLDIPSKRNCSLWGHLWLTSFNMCSVVTYVLAYTNGSFFICNIIPSHRYVLFCPFITSWVLEWFLHFGHCQCAVLNTYR